MSFRKVSFADQIHTSEESLMPFHKARVDVVRKDQWVICVEALIPEAKIKVGFKYYIGGSVSASWTLVSLSEDIPDHCLGFK
jgi:hypothetical protein